MNARLSRRSSPSVLLALIAVFVVAFSVAATVKVALAVHYHGSCASQGLVHGGNTDDSNAYSWAAYCSGREATRECQLWSNEQTSYSNPWAAQLATAGNDCSVSGFNNNVPFKECTLWANVEYPGVYTGHDHFAHNYCGEVKRNNVLGETRCVSIGLGVPSTKCSPSSGGTNPVMTRPPQIAPTHLLPDTSAQGGTP